MDNHLIVMVKVSADQCHMMGRDFLSCWTGQIIERRETRLFLPCAQQSVSFTRMHLKKMETTLKRRGIR